MCAVNVLLNQLNVLYRTPSQFHWLRRSRTGSSSGVRRFAANANGTHESIYGNINTGANAHTVQNVAKALIGRRMAVIANWNRIINVLTY